MWITLTRIDAQGANAATNAAAVGALPITGLHGAIHAALRDQGHEEPASGMIIRVHELAPRLVGKGGLGTGYATTFQGRVFAKPRPEKAKMMGGANDPAPKLDFKISVAIEVGPDCDPEALLLALRMNPFCSGRCIRIGSVSASPDCEDALDALQSSGAGLMLTDETAAMLAHAVSIKDSGLAALTDLLASDALQRHRKMAIGIGYRMLSDPICKPDARSPDIPHAYAEPLLGYAELHPLGAAEDEDRALVWRPAIDRKHNTCTLKGNPLCL